MGNNDRMKKTEKEGKMRFDFINILEYKLSGIGAGIESSNAVIIESGEECYYTDRYMLVVGKEADKFIRNNLYEFVCDGVLKIQDGKIKMTNNHIDKQKMSNTIKTFLAQVRDINEHTISGIEYLDMDDMEHNYFALKDSNGGEYLFNVDRLIFLLKGLDCLYDDIVIKKNNEVPILVFKQEGREIAYLAGEECNEKKKKKIKQKTDISEKILKEEIK